MKIKTVEYARLFSLPNYQNVRIGFTAEVEDGEEVSAIGRLAELVDKAYAVIDFINDLRSAMEKAGEEEAHLIHQVEESRESVERLKKRLEEAMKQLEKVKSGEVQEASLVCEVPTIRRQLETEEEFLRKNEDALSKLAEINKKAHTLYFTLLEKLKKGELPSIDDLKRYRESLEIFKLT